MSSRVVIWNQTLSVFGSTETGIILDVDDESPVCQWLRMFEQEAADYCVSLFDWIEATGFSELGATADTVAIANWAYAYNKPADFLRIANFTSESDRAVTSAYERLGKYIVSNITPGYIKYIRRMALVPNPGGGTDVNEMSPTLRHLIAMRLAVLIAPVFNPKMKTLAMAEYDLALREAERINQANVYIEPPMNIVNVS